MSSHNCGNCHKCYQGRPLPELGGMMVMDRMLLCPDCGSKRCPKASDHDLPCYGSNEPGQAGSVYG